MSVSNASQELLVSQSFKSQVPIYGILLLAFIAYPLLGLLGLIGTDIVILGVVSFGVILGFGAYINLRNRKIPWELKVDAQGVTVHESRVVPWEDFAEVRLSGMKPSWLFFSIFNRFKVIAFVPKAGVKVSPAPLTSYRGRFEGFSARKRTHVYGSPLVIMPYATNKTADQIIKAVEQFSTVRVVRS